MSRKRTSFSIPDIGAKIDLLCHKNGISNDATLAEALGVSVDMVFRIKSRRRDVSPEILNNLCELFNVSAQDWRLGLIDFGKKQELSYHQTRRLLGQQTSVFDFSSRMRDEEEVETVYQTFRGVWECFRFSFSQTDRKAIVRELFIVSGKTEHNLIECRKISPNYSHAGYCFPIKDHLCFLLEEENHYDEIIFYITQIPKPSKEQIFKFYGLYMGISGGPRSDTSPPIPSACRVVFHYLGRDVEEIQQEYNVDKPLEKEIPKFIDIDNNLEKYSPETREIFEDISNEVPKNVLPFVLQMKLQNKKDDRLKG